MSLKRALLKTFLDYDVLIAYLNLNVCSWFQFVLSIMLEEAADKCLEGSDMFPSLTSQNGESSMLRRILGSGGNSANAPPGRRLSLRRRKMHLAERIIQAEQAAIDAVLEPDSVEGLPAVFKIQKEPRRSVRFANLQKLRSELSQQPTPHDLYKTNTIISVKEMKHNEQQELTNDTLARGEDDRPLKSLHWKALGQRHHCDGNSLKCEKCKRVLEVKKATERFEAKRASKQLLQESNCAEKAEDEVGELGGGIQRIKREERFCRNVSLSNARTVARRSKTGLNEDASCFLIGGNSKWAQPVLSEMPKEVYKSHTIEYSPRVSTPRPVDEEFKMERDERKNLSCVSRLKLIREYMDDEPDFESEEISSWDLAPRSQTDIVFTLPCVCQRKFAEPTPLKPRILLLDMSSWENDGVSNQSDSQDIVPDREFNQNNILTFTELMDTENTAWDSPHVLDEKDGETDSESDSEEELFH